MKFEPILHRNFLFLQGPPGAFFWILAQRLRVLNCKVFRINLNGGDWADWPGEATHYRGSRKRWTLFIDRYLKDNGITDLVLFGDCRPLHMAARKMAELRMVNVHVFEEGYIRPDWLTLEPRGVNGNSSLPRDPQWYIETARALPPLPVRPSITATFKRRARDASRYYSRVGLCWPLYPFYRSHRKSALLVEFAGWLLKLARERQNLRLAHDVLTKLQEKSYFLFPLQLSNDFQIRQHSPFEDMVEAVDYVLWSFAQHAHSESQLLIKEHPLDAGFINWRRHIHARAKALGVENRVYHIAGGDLSALTDNALGMVTVNSTSATLALASGVPTIALGTAIYNIPQLTAQCKLDDFWVRPLAPEADVFDAFRRVLYDRCLIYGGLASASATETLVQSAVERLIGDEVSHWASKESSEAAFSASQRSTISK